jgi:hypothetical protein
VDLELVTVQGDTNQLLGRIVALLAFFSLILSMSAILVDPRQMTPEALQTFRWGMEHRLLSATMLVTGLCSVLCWNSIYPDRLDVLVIAPLPVRIRTVFLAKLAASATLLTVAILAINLFAGLSWSFCFSAERSGLLATLLTWVRSLLAYLATMSLIGIFMFASVLSLQGVMAQVLPHRRFVRISSIFQVAAFGLFVSMYLLQPSLTTPAALIRAESEGWIAWLPSYWFLGLLQELNGTMHPALLLLTRRACLGIALAVTTASVSFLLSYFRTVRKIVEEPDVAPGYGWIPWSPRFGRSLRTPILLFSVRTLLRSTQHRALLAFYIGVAFAIVIAYLKTPLAQRQLTPGTAGSHLNVPAMVASIVMLCAATVGTRVVFAFPAALRANWIFRVTERSGPTSYMGAVRWALIAIAILPVCAVSTVLFAYVWPWRPVAAHILVLALIGLVLVELCLHGFHKIPFTCSYLPGKSNLQIAFGLSLMGLIAVTDAVARFEREALENTARYVTMIAALATALMLAKWRTSKLAGSPEVTLAYEDTPPAVICALDLHKDGVPLR